MRQCRLNVARESFKLGGTETRDSDKSHNNGILHREIVRKKKEFASLYSTYTFKSIMKKIKQNAAIKQKQ